MKNDLSVKKSCSDKSLAFNLHDEYDMSSQNCVFRILVATGFWRALLSFTSFLAILYTLFYHYKLIAYPGLTEYREFVVLQTTRMFYLGDNPFSVNNYPLSENVHGLMHGFITGHLCNLIENCNLIYQKWFSAGCISLSTLLIIATGVRLGADRTTIVAISALFYCLNVFSYAALPRPDAFGLLLFLLAILLPVCFPRSFIAILLSVIIGICSFLTKLYFGLFLPLCLIYLFLYISVQRVVIYLLLSIVLTVSSLVVVNSVFPTYFSSMLNLTGSVEYSGKHLTRQLIEAGRAYAGILTLFVLILYFNRRKIFYAALYLIGNVIHTKVKPADRFDYKDPFYYFFIATIVGLLSFLYLGLNTGAYMLYLYQLFLPFLLLFISLDGKVNLAIKYGLLSIAFVTLFLRQGLGASEFDDIHQINWRHLEFLIKNSDSPLTSPLSAMLVDKYQKVVYLNGHNGPPKTSSNSSYEYTQEASLRNKSHAYFDSIDRKLEDRLFDLVVCDSAAYFCQNDVLNHRYYLADRFPIYLPHSRQRFQVTIYRNTNQQ